MLTGVRLVLVTGALGLAAPALAQDGDLTPAQAAAHENLVALAGDMFEGDAINVFLCIVNEASPDELAALASAEDVDALNPTLLPILPREGMQVCISDLQRQLGLTE